MAEPQRYEALVLGSGKTFGVLFEALDAEKLGTDRRFRRRGCAFETQRACNAGSIQIAVPR